MSGKTATSRAAAMYVQAAAIGIAQCLALLLVKLFLAATEQANNALRPCLRLCLLNRLRGGLRSRSGLCCPRGAVLGCHLTHQCLGINLAAIGESSLNQWLWLERIAQRVDAICSRIDVLLEGRLSRSSRFERIFDAV